MSEGEPVKQTQKDQNGQNERRAREISNCRALLCPALAVISTTFGQLAFLAGLRDASSGVYWHPAAADIYDHAIVDEVLRRQHVDTFEVWLSRNLEEQADDLAAYLREHVENRPEALRRWRQQFSYMRLAPDAALAPQRELFRSDMELVLNIQIKQAVLTIPRPVLWVRSR